MIQERMIHKSLAPWKKQLLKCVFSVVMIAMVVFGMVGCDSGDWYYETHDLAEYGHYVGDAEKFMTDYITRFFPAELSEDFQDIQYTYHSSEIDEYAFEAYLEFTIEDEALFREHVQAATEGMIAGTFHFDNSYQEYVLWDEDSGFQYDHISLNNEVTYGDPPKLHYYIHYAKIAKILVNEAEHRVIYVALALHDGGGTDTGLLDTFFSRFGIDPKEYEAYTAELSNNG